jgi:hypothetical protein
MSEVQPVVLMALMLYQVRPGADSSADKWLDPLIPVNVISHRAREPDVKTVSLSEYAPFAEAICPGIDESTIRATTATASN